MARDTRTREQIREALQRAGLACLACEKKHDALMKPVSKMAARIEKMEGVASTLHTAHLHSKGLGTSTHLENALSAHLGVTLETLKAVYSHPSERHGWSLSERLYVKLCNDAGGPAAETKLRKQIAALNQEEETMQKGITLSAEFIANDAAWTDAMMDKRRELEALEAFDRRNAAKERAKRKEDPLSSVNLRSKLQALLDGKVQFTFDGKRIKTKGES